MMIRSTARVYIIMLAALATSLLLRWLLDPWLGDYLPLVTIYGVVVLAVWIGGYRVAALAVIFGYLACDYWFMEPRGQFGFSSSHNFIRSLAYLTGCAIIIGFGEAMRAVLRRAESRGLQLEQEVRQRQKAEEMLWRRNKDMEQLLEALPVAVWVAHDPECQTVTGNLAAERLHGVQPGTNISATLPREERHWVRHVRNGQELSVEELPLQQTIATGNSLENLEFEMELPDGRIINLLCNTVPLRDDEGQVRGAVAACQDISTLKTTERQMRESEERFAKAFSASPLSLTISSLKTGKLIEVNETFVNITGYAREEAIGRTTVELGVWANLQDREAEMDTVRQLGGIRNTEYVFKRKNGEEIIGLLSAECLDLGGEPCALTVIQDITERKRTEERYRGLFTSMQEGFLLAELIEDSAEKGLDFRYLDVNPAAEQMLGLKRAQIVGKTAREIIPEGREDMFEMYAQVVRTGEPLRHELFEPMLNQYHENFAFRPARGQVAILFWDITERKQAEQALRVSEERFRLATSAGSVGVWDWDIASNTVSWSDSIYEIHGLQPGEFDGTVEAFAELVHPDDRALVNEAIQRALQDGAPYQLEFRAIHSDGSIIWISTQAQVIRDASGKPLRMLGGTVDITQRKQAEIALRQSEERFRLASDAGAALVYDIDLTDERKIIVHGLASLTGYQSDEADLTSEWWHSLIHPADLLTHLEIVEQHIKTGGRYLSVYRIRHKTGDWIWVEDNAQVIKNASGVSIQLVGAIVDITAQQQAMAEEKRLREVAEAHNRAKDEFLTVVSHELRSPLNAILGYARLTRTTPRDIAAVVRNCEVIERNARAQQQLIEDLLDTARIISGKLKLELALADLRLVLEESVEVVRPAAEVKRISLTAQLDQSPQSLLCDAARLRQVSWNLLQNAIKFTPEGGHVEFRVECDDSFVRLIVSDTGRGIEADFLPAVFDRFSQSDMSSTRRHGGLGLGLALVKQLVELHGGKIEAASAGLGQGATFTVTLPLSMSQATSYLPPRAIAELSAQPEVMTGLPRLDGARVLVVDDQEEARALVAQVLSDRGAVVTMAASGHEALTRLDASVFDALVCDVAMPEMSGYEVVARLRTMEMARGVSHEQRLPAIALTALARAEDRVQAMAAGFQLYIAKPVDLGELIIIVNSLTRNRQKGAVIN